MVNKKAISSLWIVIPTILLVSLAFVDSIFLDDVILNLVRGLFA